MQRGQGLKPLLQQIYETRARSYRDAVQEFVKGYREGYVGQPVATASNQKEEGSQQEHSLSHSEVSTRAANESSHSQQTKSDA